MNKTVLAIVIPSYNEEESLPKAFSVLNDIINDLVEKDLIDSKSYIYVVDDGSTDKSWDLISEAHNNNPERIKGVKFTKNFGNQSSIIAGLESVRELGCDAAITIDADLQQDETKIIEFVQKFQEGNDIVAGIRKDRNTDDFIKKSTSTLFYKTMNFLGSHLVPNHSEYRLVSKRALDVLAKYNETNLFLRGLFFEFGLKTAYVYFDVKKREHGVSKFNLISLMRLAVYGIVAFSTRPLRFVFFTGFIISALAMCFGLFALAQIIFHGHGLKYLTAFEIFITFILGLQILCIGIIGEYIGQMFQEVKARPRYIKDIELK